MDASEHRPLRPGERGRLVVALVLLSAFAVLCAVGVGTTLHGWAETQDSLEHWQARLEKEAQAPEASRTRPGIDAPAARIQRLEEELDAIPERLFAQGGMLLFFGLLVFLGVRRLRSG